jgi:CubicO group peptidase (beta-lactamase class C family)
MWFAAVPSLCAEQTTFDHETISRVDRFIEEEVSRGDVPGVAVVLVDAERVVHARGFGLARPGGERVTPTTAFQIGSVSKSFTAVAVAQLVERGQLALDSPVRRYLPWFMSGATGASERVTVHELLTHTSGLSASSGRRGFEDTDDSARALERSVRALSPQDLESEPGREFVYSNSNYQVLGSVIEAVSGEPYAEYVARNVFAPLGMSHSFADGRSARGAAVGSRYWFGRAVAARDLSAPRSLAPAAGLFVSARDLGAYLCALLREGQGENGRILSNAAARQLFVPNANAGPSDGYAMGWLVAPAPTSFAVWHDGSTANFHAHVAMDLASRRGFAVLVNAESQLSGPRIRDLGFGVLRILRGQAPEPISRTALPWQLSVLIGLACLQLAGAGISIGRARRVPRRPKTARLAAVLAFQIGAVVVVLVEGPLIVHTTLAGMLMFAPDAGYLLAMNAVLSVAWAGARTALLSLRPR